jgi:hypothetical protein
MKLVGILTTVLLLAAPVAAGAQGHGGMGAAHVGIVHAGFHGHGHGAVGRGGDFRGGFRGGGLLLWGYPYWGWDCAADSIGCDWGGDAGAGPADIAYGGGPAPGDPACGAWVRRAGAYAWAPDACNEPPAAADPPRRALASNECSDWVWRADLHHSVCKQRAAG